MYPYHNKIKQRIKNREYVGKKYVNDYNKIKGRVLLLYFETEPKIKPIRPHKFEEYEELLRGLI